MFAASLFAFIGQLYVLPPAYVTEIREYTLKFMLGPKAWLHGDMGHAFFRAQEDLGFPVGIRCVLSANLQCMYTTIPRHVFDFATKLHTLESSLSDNAVLCRPLFNVISDSPYACCRIVSNEAQRLHIQRHLVDVQVCDKINFNKTIYNSFFNSLYHKHASIIRLEEVYRKRWCKQSLLNTPQPQKLATAAAKHLRWISKRLPPRVHIACCRFQFNGWHTGTRYQKRDSTRCMFCKSDGAEDSIEHFVFCRSIQDLFPSSLRTDHPDRVPLKYFFLHDLDGRHRLTFALIIYSIYAVHNDFRHSANHSDFKKCIYQSIADVHMNKQIRCAVSEILDVQF